jgi:DNA primase
MDEREQAKEEIKHRLPIDQVVGKYVPLKRAGRTLKANCPFHNEKTPSFTINTERGIYKCFGCGEGGDIFDFMMKIEGVTFPEAMQLLADQAGVTLPERMAARPQTGPSKTDIYEANTTAAAIWHAVLTRHPKGEDARDYLKQRGLSLETVQLFQIGYAPPGTGTALALEKQGVSRAASQAAGELTRFQDRITFPITDLTGRVIGFTGRILEHPNDPVERNRGPKYWNTPETPVFIKSRAVYALHLAKRAIEEHDVAILAEGQMDVVTLHQFGYTNTVASSGTALTREQLQLIGRFSQNIAFAYDQDGAGQTATERGAELCLELGLTPYVIVTPIGKDPADCLNKNPDAWADAYTTRTPFIEWMIRRATNPAPTTPQAKRLAEEQIVPWLRRVLQDTERTEWAHRFAGYALYTPAEEAAFLQQVGAIAPVSQENQPAQQATQEVPLVDRAYALLLQFPALLKHPEQLPLEILAPHATTPFSESVSATLAAGTEATKEQLLGAENALTPYAAIELDAAYALQEIHALARRLHSDSREDIKQHLSREIRAAQQRGDSARVQELFKELQGAL